MISVACTHQVTAIAHWLASHGLLNVAYAEVYFGAFHCFTRDHMCPRDATAQPHSESAASVQSHGECPMLSFALFPILKRFVLSGAGNGAADALVTCIAAHCYSASWRSQTTWCYCEP